MLVDLGGGEALQFQLRRIEDHADLSVDPAFTRDCRHAREAAQLLGHVIIDVPAQLLERHVGGFCGEEGDRRARRIDALNGGLEDSLGQIASNLRNGVPNVIYRTIDGCSDLQLNDGLAVSFTHRTIDFIDAIDAANGGFNLLRDLLFHLGRSRTGLAHADEDNRKIDVRILRDRHLAEGDYSSEHQADEKNDRCDWISDAPRRNVAEVHDDSNASLLISNPKGLELDPG